MLRAVGHSYPRLLLGLIISDLLLTPVVPSGIARVVIMAAIAMGLADAFGVGKGSNIARGMFIILVYQATNATMRSHGRNASAHWLQRTWTPPNFSIAPRAVIDAAPAMTILSKSVAV